MARSADITMQIASALSAAHRKGIVHRDLKPQNIFLLPAEDDQPERVKVLDFGISKIRSVSRRLTATAVVLGTPQFMAPEQAEGRDDLDAAADQFSLAAITYEMLTGRPAFAGDTLASVVYQIVHVDPLPVTHLRPDLPDDIQRVMARALSKKKQDRFASASAFARQVDQIARAVPQQTSDTQVMNPGRLASAPSLGRDARRSETLPFGATPALATTTFGRTTGELLRLPKIIGSRIGKLLAAGRNVARDVAGSGFRRRALTGAVVSIVAGIALFVGFKNQTAARRVTLSSIAVEGVGMGRGNAPLVQPLPAPPQEPAPALPSAQAIPTVGSPTVAMDLVPARRAESVSLVDFDLASDPPGLAVWIDDNPFPDLENQAVTRMRGQLAAGTHTLALTKAGFAPWRKQVELKAGGPNRFLARLVPVKEPEDPASIFAQLQPPPGDRAKAAESPPSAVAESERCRVTIGAVPWAELWVDGKDIRRHTPVISLNLPCGVHQINLRRPDLAIDFQTEVTLIGGEDFKRVFRIGSGK